jgi:hypothetical protein
LNLCALLDESSNKLPWRSPSFTRWGILAGMSNHCMGDTRKRRRESGGRAGACSSGGGDWGVDNWTAVFFFFFVFLSEQLHSSLCGQYILRVSQASSVENDAAQCPPHVCRVSQASSVESDAAQCPPHVCHCFCAPFIKKGNYLGPKHTVNLTRNLYWEKSLVYLSCKIATSSNLYYI